MAGFRTSKDIASEIEELQKKLTDLKKAEEEAKQKEKEEDEKIIDETRDLMVEDILDWLALIDIYVADEDKARVAIKKEIKSLEKTIKHMVEWDSKNFKNVKSKDFDKMIDGFLDFLFF